MGSVRSLRFSCHRHSATAHDANGLNTRTMWRPEYKMNEMLGSLGNGDMNT